ncbi:MAG: tetratricopeptide repeat protein [Gemmataceae bacterium]
MNNEHDPAATLNEEGVALMRQGRLEEARARWDESLRWGELPEVDNNLGFLHSCLGDLDQAIRFFARALALRPRYPEALNNLGIALFQTGRPDEAERAFREAIAESPRYAEALNNLGSLLLHQGRAAEAAACYRASLEARGDNAETWSNLGVALKDIGAGEEAIECWRRSLAYNAGDANVHRNLGTFLSQRGRLAEALDCYQQVAALRPDDAGVRFVVEALRGAGGVTQMPADYVTQLFDSYAAHFDKDLVDRLGYRGPALLKAVLSPAPPRHSLDILDLGCGTGLCGAAFRDWAKRLVGVDLSPRMLAEAQRRGVYDELIEEELLTTLRQAEGAFDLILAGDVLVYLGDLRPLFEAARRALRPGGRFAFTIELAEGSGYRLLASVRFAHGLEYVRRRAAAAGFEELRQESIVIRLEDGLPLAGLVMALGRTSA